MLLPRKQKYFHKQKNPPMLKTTIAIKMIGFFCFILKILYSFSYFYYTKIFSFWGVVVFHHMQTGIMKIKIPLRGGILMNPFSVLSLRSLTKIIRWRYAIPSQSVRSNVRDGGRVTSRWRVFQAEAYGSVRSRGSGSIP